LCDSSDVEDLGLLGHDACCWLKVPTVSEERFAFILKCQRSQGSLLKAVCACEMLGITHCPTNQHNIPEDSNPQ